MIGGMLVFINFGGYGYGDRDTIHRSEFAAFGVAMLKNHHDAHANLTAEMAPRLDYINSNMTKIYDGLLETHAKLSRVSANMWAVRAGHTVLIALMIGAVGIISYCVFYAMLTTVDTVERRCAAVAEPTVQEKEAVCVAVAEPTCLRSDGACLRSDGVCL